MTSRRRALAIGVVVVVIGAAAVAVMRRGDDHVRTSASTSTTNRATSLSPSTSTTTTSSTTTTASTSTTMTVVSTTAATSPVDSPAVAPDVPAPAPGPGLADARIALTRVASIANPIAGAVWPASGVLHIATRDGKVFALNGGVRGPLLDIGASTTTDGERGLLGIAFAGSSLFVSYSNLAGDNQLDRYAMNGDGTVDHQSRATVLTVAHPTYSNHYGGGIVLGPDGLLYWGLGDGGGSGDPLGNAQRLDTFRGKLVQIDPATGSAAIADWGLRNPWRFSFDRANGDLYIADVGQNQYEEIDYLPAGAVTGANFGWNLREGFHSYNGGSRPPGNVDPIFEYAHNDGLGRCAVTGGYVYRGARIPALQGAYLFSDLCGGEVHALTNDGGRVTLERDLGVGTGDVESFAEDAAGELYVLSFGSGGVYRVDPA